MCKYKPENDPDCEKIIIETNQCVSACPENEFEFGDFWYNSCDNNVYTDFGLAEKNESKKNINAEKINFLKMKIFMEKIM